MSVSKSFAGTTYVIPETGDSGGWGDEVSAFLQALADKAISIRGGTHELTTADLNFGATYGLVSAYYKSRGSNLSSAGILRMANNESIGWRNAANSADKILRVNASDVLEYDGNPIVTLALGTANHILRMNSGGTAYEWGELADANIAAAAAIAHSKMAALTASRAMVTDGSGFASASAVTATELGYVSGVTSAIQTQLDGKISTALTSANILVGNGSNVAAAVAVTGDVTISNSGVTAIATGAIVDADINASAAIAYSKLALTGSIVNADINASAAIADTKLATISTAGKVSNSATTATDSNTASAIVARDASGNFSAGTITASLSGNATNVTGTVAIANGGTGQTSQTAAFDALAPTTTKGDVIVHNGSDNIRVAVGANGQVLTADSAQASGVKWADAGGGSGEKNYITNPSAKSDADGAVPAGWAASSVRLTVTKTDETSELPRENTTGSGIKIVSADTGATSGDYVYFDFNLDDVDTNLKNNIKWAQKILATYAAGELEVYIAAQSNRAVAIGTPAVSAIPAADFNFNAQGVDTNSTTAVSLVIKATGAITVGDGIVISDVIVGPGQVMPVPAIGGWVDFTPTFTNTTLGNGTQKGRYRRVGDSMELEAIFTLGSTSSVGGTITFTIPDSKTIQFQTGVSYGMFGWVHAYDASPSSGRMSGVVTQASSTTLGFSAAGAGGSDFNATTPFTWTNGDTLQFKAFIPIAEWAGAPNYAGQNDVEYASVGGTWDAASSTTVYGPSGVQMGGALTAQRIKTVTFLSTIQPTDAIEIQMSRDGVVWTPMIGSVTTAGRIVSSMTNNAGSLMGAAWEKNSANSILVYFGRYSSVENDDGAGYDWGTDYWRVVKTRAGAAVGFGLADTSGRAGLVNPYTEGSGVVYSGTYTPTLTNLTNIDASTAFKLQYMRVGKVVTVSGIVNIDPSASGDIDLRMSLPSGLDMSTEATVPAGGAASGEGADNLGIDKASTTAVRFLGNPVTRTNRTYRFIFMYRMD